MIFLTPDNITPWSPTRVFAPWDNWTKSYAIKNNKEIFIWNIFHEQTVSSAVTLITRWNNLWLYSFPKRILFLIDDEDERTKKIDQHNQNKAV